ncbi:MAG: hypothetical protein K0R54_1519 [Clostridiaceae bacterium]|jgi:predicted transcriptional regulator|nr:hypothetical protein [Clostridiaceae bacterium]
MFEDTLELAENKLLLLYIFSKMKFSVSNNQITQIILENNFINYFTLQQYMTELVATNFIATLEEDNKHKYIITDKGKKVLSLFEDRISKDKLDQIDNYLKKQMENIKKEVTCTADYTIDDRNNFVVDLKALENDSLLIDLKVSVGSNKQARELCTKWKSNSSKLYNEIINILINE